ncbi:MAG TPA: calcium-binding protein [Allosphingosinicella sp.]|nr:calcium-binding protein [Allosphingosinicella sp.]
MATINGTPGDDSLFGTSGDDDIHGFDGNDGMVALEGNDILDGGNGHDFMRGREGNDQIFGGNDDDYLDGGIGDDLLDGGAGWDRATYAPSATNGVTVDLNIVGIAQNTGQGMDTLTGIEHLSGTIYDDTLIGDGGDNWIWGGSNGTGVTGNDTISGNGGNDLISVGTGNHSLDGGLDNDTLGLFGNDTDITAAGVTVSLALQGATQDTEQGMMFLAGFENVSGSKYDDFLTGDGNVNILLGDLGNDNLSGGGGNDTLYGDGRTLIDDHDTGGSGSIVTYSDVSLIPFAGAPGDDILDGGAGDDILNGGGGSDSASYASSTAGVFVNLTAGVGDDGMGGTDTLVSIENFLGSAYNDFARGDSGANVLAGFAGHDFMRGMDGADTLKGGDDDDYLDGGQGDDIIDGGTGWDRAAYSPSALAGVTVDLNIVGIAQATGQGNDTLTGIEHVSGTRFNDVLTGDAGDNWIWGGSDGSGVTGNDILNGGGGNDLIQVGTGNHNLNGGTGTDTLSLHGNGTDITAAGVTVSLLLQGMAQATEQGSMTLNGFENISASLFDDFLTGNNSDNLLAGDSGADSLSGGDGADTLYGDGRVIVDHHGTGGSGPIVTYVDASDLPFGDPAGNDVLNGGKGDDTLWGGGGDDVLTGGKGSDLFGFGPGDGDDRITDFEKMKDTIFFQGVSGVDDFGDLTFTKVGGDVLITWGTSDSILLEGVKLNQIHASDFMFG